MDPLVQWIVYCGLGLIVIMVASIIAMPYARRNPIAKNAMIGFFVLFPMGVLVAGALAILKVLHVI